MWRVLTDLPGDTHTIALDLHDRADPAVIQFTHDAVRRYSLSTDSNIRLFELNGITAGGVLPDGRIVVATKSGIHLTEPVGSTPESRTLAPILKVSLRDLDCANTPGFCLNALVRKIDVQSNGDVFSVLELSNPLESFYVRTRRLAVVKSTRDRHDHWTQKVIASWQLNAESPQHLRDRGMVLENSFDPSLLAITRKGSFAVAQQSRLSIGKPTSAGDFTPIAPVDMKDHLPSSFAIKGLWAGHDGGLLTAVEKVTYLVFVRISPEGQTSSILMGDSDQLTTATTASTERPARVDEEYGGQNRDLSQRRPHELRFSSDDAVVAAPAPSGGFFLLVGSGRRQWYTYHHDLYYYDNSPDESVPEAIAAVMRSVVRGGDLEQLRQMRANWSATEKMERKLTLDLEDPKLWTSRLPRELLRELSEFTHSDDEAEWWAAFRIKLALQTLDRCVRERAMTLGRRAQELPGQISALKAEAQYLEQQAQAKRDNALQLQREVKNAQGKVEFWHEISNGDFSSRGVAAEQTNDGTSAIQTEGVDSPEPAAKRSMHSHG